MARVGEYCHDDFFYDFVCSRCLFYSGMLHARWLTKMLERLRMDAIRLSRRVKYEGQPLRGKHAVFIRFSDFYTVLTAD